ncbi:MAG: hypothetical protein Q9157_003927 [Trypethelium eluteriae]
MTQTQSAFESALADFEKDLKPEEKQSFQYTKIEDVKLAILEMQKDQERTNTMRNLNRIQPFLMAMEEFSRIIEVFLNASPFVCYIWGPLKFLLQVRSSPYLILRMRSSFSIKRRLEEIMVEIGLRDVRMTASKFADSFEKLLDAYRQIGEHIPLLSQYSQLFEGSEDIRKLLRLIFTDILEFHRKALKFFSRPDFKSRFGKILERLDSHKKLLSEQAWLHAHVNYQADSQGLQTYFQDYSKVHDQIKHHIEQYEEDRIRLEEREEERARKKKKSVLDWIAGDESDQGHDAKCTIRESCPGSGNWILKHEKIENWRDAQTPKFSTAWLNGKPGAGDPVRNNSVSVFKGLLRQSLEQCPELLPYCDEKRNGELTLNTPKVVKDLLKIFSDFVPKQYVIIDGLDECDDLTERKEIMTFMNQLVKDSDARAPGSLRVLFVSQIFNDIKRELSAASIEITLRPEDNQGDIQRYVQQEVEELRIKYVLDKEQANHVRERTCFRADGMFLFAVLVMKNLKTQPTKGDFLYEISENRFPDDLKKAYERILSSLKRNLPPKLWKIATQLLGWMICAKRPLKWHEIQGAISIDPEAQTIFEPENILRVDISELCGSLVQLLPGDRIDHVKNSEYVRAISVECDLTVLCLQYLAFQCFVEENEAELLNYARRGHFVLQDYAVAKWYHHVETLLLYGKKLFEEESGDQLKLPELEQALDDFAETYESDLPDGETLPDAQTREDCEPFRVHEAFYAYLLPIWDHVLKHRSGAFENRNTVSLKTLGNSLERNRKILEASAQQKDLRKLYGKKLFKCPKLTCYYFHEGFADAKSRDQHLKKHERPFICQIPDCSYAEFGFVTNKDLDKHMRTFHEEECDPEESFSSSSKKTTEKTRYICEVCSAKFTRNINLRSHQRAHKGERPFPCPQCGKAFTRLSDRKRHEKIHDRHR